MDIPLRTPCMCDVVNKKKTQNPKTKQKKKGLWELFQNRISTHIKLNWFSYTVPRDLRPPYMKFSQTGRTAFNSDREPICSSNKQTKKHWQAKVEEIHNDFLTCYKSHIYLGIKYHQNFIW